jgi:predicted RNA-binding protein with PIN domain
MVALYKRGNLSYLDVLLSSTNIVDFVSNYFIVQEIAEYDSEDLKELAEVNIEAARGKLADILCNYQGYKGCTLILVFDAYKVIGNTGEMTTGAHLHFELWHKGESVDPTKHISF